jgi:acyl dehydratase
MARLTIEAYLDLLKDGIGTVYQNEWSPNLFGPRFPRPLRFSTQVTRDSIRRLVDATGDLNPLYRDQAYAAQTRFGALLAPPSVLYGFAYGFYVDPHRFPTSPDFPNTYAGDQYEWYRPLAVGEDVDFTTTFPTRIDVKQTRVYGTVGFVWGKHEFRRRLGGEPVATCRFCMGAHARRSTPADGPPPKAQYSPEQIREVYQTQDAEAVRGAEPRYWEDVRVGDGLTPIVRGPYSVMDRVAWTMAAVGEPFFVCDRVYRFMHEYSGWGTFDPDWNVFRNFHDDLFDKDYQISFGAQRTAWIVMALTNWLGDDGFLWKLTTSHRVGGGNGWLFWCRPRVIRTYQEAGRCCVEIDCPLENQVGTVVTTAQATVLLPSRGHGPVVYPTPPPEAYESPAL